MLGRPSAASVRGGVPMQRRSTVSASAWNPGNPPPQARAQLADVRVLERRADGLHVQLTTLDGTRRRVWVPIVLLAAVQARHVVDLRSVQAIDGGSHIGQLAADVLSWLSVGNPTPCRATRSPMRPPRCAAIRVSSASVASPTPWWCRASRSGVRGLGCRACGGGAYPGFALAPCRRAILGPFDR